ncbi:MAG: hypothetical protein M5U26_24625 [Planctomycetota bacterium]|nr:hypothetical protein [Planctomycetota bacterium]
MPGGGPGWVKCTICDEVCAIGGAGAYDVPSNMGLPKRVELPKAAPDAANLREVARPRPPARFHPGPGYQDAEQAPAAKLAEPKDFDKMLATYALGLFRVRGWPCQDLPGYKAFIVRARIANPDCPSPDVCNVTISAARGVLTLETVVRALPPPPWTTLRETLNAINQCSGGSLFLMRECGVVVRYKLVPQATPEGRFHVDNILGALRQMNHDRRLALHVLHMAGQWSVFDARAVRRAFASPVVEPKPVPLSYLQDLAGFAGYYAVERDGILHLNKEICAPAECPIRMRLEDGVIRAWTVLAPEVTSKFCGERWEFVRKIMRHLTRSSNMKLTRSQASRLLEHLNVLNDTSALLRYLWTEDGLSAIATHTMLEPELSVEEFQLLTDALFRRTVNGPGHTTLALRNAV